MRQAIGKVCFVTDGGHKNGRVSQVRTGGFDHASNAEDSFFGSRAALDNVLYSVPRRIQY